MSEMNQVELAKRTCNGFIDSAERELERSGGESLCNNAELIIDAARFYQKYSTETDEQIKKLREALLKSQKLINTVGDIHFNKKYSAKEKEKRIVVLFDVHGDDIFLANKKLLDQANEK